MGTTLYVAAVLRTLAGCPLSRPRERCILRTPAIHRSKIIAVVPRHLEMILLLPRRRKVILVFKCHLTLVRTHLNPTCAAIEARSNIRPSVNHGPILIHVMHDNAIHIQHRGVVGKPSALPAPANKPNTAITKPIVDAAIKTDMRPPVAGMEQVRSTAPAPVSRSPQQADRGG